MSERTDRPLLYKITFIFFSIFIIFSGISITVSQGALLIAFVLWMIGLLKGMDGFQYHISGLEKNIGMFVVISIVLALLSPSVLNNLLYLKDFWLITAFVLASSLLRKREDLKRIIYILIFVALFQSIMGFVQYYTNINFLIAYNLGLDHWRSKLINNHIAGFMGQHLTFGGYMMLLSIPLFFLSFLKKKNNDEIPGYLIKASAIMSFIAIILSWSRSVIIALPFSIVPLFIKRRKSFIIFFTIIAVIIVILFSQFGPAKGISENIYNVSTKIRFQIWDNAIKVCKRHPIIGTGGGNYNDVFREEVKKNIKERKLFIKYFPARVTHAHNDYLNQLARKGIIGFLAFLYMLYGILKYMFDNQKRIENKFLRYVYMGLFGSFTAFLMSSMFQCYFTDEENLVMLWLNVGLLVSVVRMGTKKE